MKKETVTTKAWLTNTYTTFKDLEGMSAEQLVRSLSYHPEQISNWVEVGTANITVTLHSPEVVNVTQVAILRSQISLVNLEAAKTISMLNDKINSLLALPNLSGDEDDFV